MKNRWSGVIPDLLGESGRVWMTLCCTKTNALLNLDRKWFLLGTSCINVRTMHVGRGFLEIHPHKAAVQFLSEMERRASCKLFVDYYSRFVLHIATNLVVSSWASLLSIYSCLLSGVSRVTGNKLASGVLEAIAIGLRKKEKNSKAQVCLSKNFRSNYYAKLTSNIPD